MWGGCGRGRFCPFFFFFLVTAESSGSAPELEVKLNNLQQKQAAFSLPSFQRRSFCACCSASGVPASAA